MSHKGKSAFSAGESEGVIIHRSNEGEDVEFQAEDYHETLTDTSVLKIRRHITINSNSIEEHCLKFWNEITKNDQ